jgi:hypothetical protein
MDLQLEKQMSEIKGMVMDIHRVVLGSEHEKDLGLLSRVKELEQKVDKLENTMKKIKWIAIGWALPASVGVLEFLRAIIIK